jgi:hypothetical protein
VGRREDILQHVDGTLKIARRKIILDQNVLLAKNVSIFFQELRTLKAGRPGLQALRLGKRPSGSR